MKAPGAVARCPECEEVVMVIVDVRGAARVNLAGIDLGGRGPEDRSASGV